MSVLRPTDVNELYKKDPARAVALTKAAFVAFEQSPQGASYAQAEKEYGGAQYWIEKLKAGDHQEAGTPVFHLAVVVDDKDGIAGLATSDYYIGGPKGGQFAQPVYNVVKDPANAATIEQQLRETQFKQLRDTADRVGGGVLRALVEEMDGSRPLMGGQAFAGPYAQGFDPAGKPYHNEKLGLQVVPVDDPNVKAVLESFVHAQHPYFNGSTIEEARAKGTLNPEIDRTLAAIAAIPGKADRIEADRAGDLPDGLPGSNTGRNR